MSNEESNYSVVLNAQQADFQGDLKCGIHKIVSTLASKFNTNISSLDKIVLSENYEQDIRNYGEIIGRKIKITNNNLGQGIGITITSKIKSKDTTVIFLNYNLVIGLLSKHRNDILIHLIHHELCHIDDASKNPSSDTFNDGKEMVDINDLVLNYSKSMWKEYYAHRKSAQTLPPDYLADYTGFIEIAKVIDQTISSHIQTYRSNFDLDDVLIKSEPYISYSLDFMARISGNIDGGAISLEDAAGDDFIDLIKTSSYATYRNIIPRLQKLYDSYPLWESELVFNELNDVVNNYFKLLGIFFKIIENGQLHVNFKATGY